MRAPLALLVAALVPLAGCFGGEPVGTAQTDAPPANDTNATFANPEGREQPVAFQETNRTEAGAGGVEHKHDYWEGRESVVVAQGEHVFAAFPLFPDGEGSDPKNVAYVKLPEPNLVFEGTAQVEVLVAAPEVTSGVASPSPVGMTLSYRTAADAEYRDLGAITFGTPLVIPVEPRETDMPHSKASLWSFRVATERPDYSTIDVTVTIKRGATIEDWPGHPDFYADRTQRVVLDKEVTTVVHGTAKVTLYGRATTWAHPDFLLSDGTGSFDVFVNVTSVNTNGGLDPTRFTLQYHNATVLDTETDGLRTTFDVGDVEGGLHFFQNMTEHGMDGPYQGTSRWGFRLMPDYSQNGKIGCAECFDLEVTYHIKVVARKDGA